MVQTLLQKQQNALLWVVTMHSNASRFLPYDYTLNPEAFFWPVARTDVVHVRNHFIKKMIDISKTGDKPYHALYPVLSLLWVNHIIQSYQILLACHLFKEQGKSPHLTGDKGFLRAAYNDTAPPIPEYIFLLENGAPLDNPFIESLRGVKRALSKTPISYKPLCLMDFKNDIVISSTGELIFKHAQEQQRPLFYVPRGYWFKTIDKNLLAPEFDCNEFINVVKESFGAYASLLTPAFVRWFKEIYTRSMRAIWIHIDRIQSTPHSIPMRYWMGSGGVMWDRIMKHIVKSNGGLVTGHDHGSGIGHIKSISRALSECNDCDFFVSFAHNKDLVLQAFDKNYLFNDIPDIITLNNRQKHKAALSLKTSNAENIRKILIIPYGPDENVARFIATPHDSVKVDLLIRVINKLQTWGYDVYLKPHPGCPPPLENSYLEQSNIHLLSGTIDDAFKNTDAVLFLHNYTTTFREAFSHNMPVILIDSSYEEWVEDAYQKLEARCSIIKSFYDTQNRICVDWDQLKIGIETSVTKNDSEYSNNYC